MSNSTPRYPFEVGEKYRNENGAYTVIRLDEQEMEIKYESGGMLVSPIRLQARIWERIQLEEEMSAQKAAKRKPDRRRAGSRSRSGYGRDFEGLTEKDFNLDLAGTSWRRREELGGLLAERLSGISGDTFDSHAVPRRPQVHIVSPHHYQKKLRVAKFLFDLSNESAFYGFYIEKSDNSMDDSWDWLRFLPALAEDKNLHARTLIAMQHCDLCWTINMKTPDNRYVVVEEETLYLQSAEAGASDDDRTALDWDGFVELLNAIPENSWCNLYLAARMDKSRAIELGVALAGEVTGVYNALLPLYEASLQA